MPHASLRRHGAVVVEFAVTAPILFMLIFGAVEFARMTMLRHTAATAAYEGARRGVGRGRTNSDVVNRVEEFLSERNITYSGDVVDISAPGFGGADTLENVTVTVNLPTEGNLLIPSSLFGDMNISASVTMRKEYKNLE